MTRTNTRPVHELRLKSHCGLCDVARFCHPIGSYRLYNYHSTAIPTFLLFSSLFFWSLRNAQGIDTPFFFFSD